MTSLDMLPPINEAIKSKSVKQIRDYLYSYFYSADKRLLNIKVYQKGFLFFKKYYGEYRIYYQNNKIQKQISFVDNLGITEQILYSHKNGLLSEVLYYNEKDQLRYTVTIEYNGNAPSFMNIIRMQKFPFFESDNSETINLYLNGIGKDFEGSFYLLDFIEKAKEKDA